MIFTAEPAHIPRFEFNPPVLVQAVADATYDGRQTPTRDAFEKFTFEQTAVPIEGGNLTLFLTKNLILKMDFHTMRYTVLDWGIEMDCASLPQLPREISRRFLQLFNSAENDSLSENDQAAWLQVLDYVDFKQFSIDRSAPRYMEGVLLHKDDFTYVEWHDGSKQKIQTRIANALSDVNLNEHFSAFVKLGKNDEILAIERVSLLTASQTENWESWPTKS